MRRVALTGGIATGKSTVAAVLRARGLPVVDSDRLARDAVAPGSDGLAEVVARFGAAVLDPTGALDRAALGRRVFADGTARRDLERIVHPRVRTGVAAFFAAAAGPAAVAEVPLVYETGWFTAFDTVVVAACHPRIQAERLRTRDGLDDAAIAARLAAQWPIEDKVRLADGVLRTDGTLEQTARAAEALADWLLR